MVRTSKTGNAREPRCWPERADADAENGDPVHPAQATTSVRRNGSPSAATARFGTSTENISSILKDVAASPAMPPPALSVRAENVLKELAMELTGECPPKGLWVAPDRLLRKLSFRHLQAARNCGPQTTAEIVEWAGLRGVVIRPPSHAGKSLSAMWHDLVARFSSGDFSKAEIAEALERSARRRNTRIPVAFQDILLKVLNSSGK